MCLIVGVLALGKSTLPGSLSFPPSFDSMIQQRSAATATATIGQEASPLPSFRDTLASVESTDWSSTLETTADISPQPQPDSRSSGNVTASNWLDQNGTNNVVTSASPSDRSSDKAPRSTVNSDDSQNQTGVSSSDKDERSVSAHRSDADNHESVSAGHHESLKRAKKAAAAALAPTMGTGDAVDSVAPALAAAAGQGFDASSVASANQDRATGQDSAASDSATTSVSATGKATNPPLNGNSVNPLAFALRLQNIGSTAGNGIGQAVGNPASDSAGSGQPGNTAQLSSFAQQLQAISGSTATTAAVLPTNLDPSLQSIPTPSAEPGANYQEGAKSQASEDAAGTAEATAVTEADTIQSQTAPPLRSMQVQVTGQDNQKLDLRLVERSGSLSMSVRTMDSTLTRSLQEHLPELTNKLESSSLQAEWWTPKSEAATAGGSSSHSGESHPQDQSSQDKPSRDKSDPQDQQSDSQQNSRQQNQPKWVEELARLGNSQSTRKEYIWHQ